MIAMTRGDTSVVGRWWWTIDRWSLAAIICIVALGAILTMAATPPVAERLGIDSYHFARRQLFFLPTAVLLMLAISMLTPQQVRRFAHIGFLVAIGMLAMTLLVGQEVKGSRRWLSMAGFSLQPSEFVKPLFAVVAAWMFTRAKLNRRFPGRFLAIGLYAAVMSLLIMQPDLGMAIVITVVWFGQFFLSGLPLYMVALGGATGVAGVIGAYMSFSHVRSRVDRFLDPATGDSFQINTALEAFLNGGIFGRGPGEGTVKASLPDAHTDFVLAVAGEEFGLVVCLLIVALFAFVVLRGMTRLLNETSLFLLLGAGGLLIQFGLQAFINMASTVQLMPTKGMTLPFLSYGGSSALAMALTLGMLLALTRRRSGIGEVN